MMKFVGTLIKPWRAWPIAGSEVDVGEDSAFDSRKYLKQRSGESHRNLLSLMRQGSSSSTASFNSKASSPGSLSRTNR